MARHDKAGYDCGGVITEDVYRSSLRRLDETLVRCAERGIETRDYQDAIDILELVTYAKPDNVQASKLLQEAYVLKCGNTQIE